MAVTTIMISTRDRSEDLKNLLDRLRKLNNYGEIEVIVTDDCGRENIKELFQKDYPEAIFRRSKTPFGYIHHRNSMFKMAKGDYVFSIDDDAWYETRDSIKKAIKVFEENPKAAILNFKVNLPNGRSVPEDISGVPAFPVGVFIGCAHAIRKRCFAHEDSLYDELYFRQGEERDLAIKCLENGYEILQVNDVAVFHDYRGSNRDHQAIHSCAFRNELFFYLKYFPGLKCPAFLIASVFKHAAFCFRKLWPRAFFRGIYGFFSLFFVELKKRKPVKKETLRKYLQLKKGVKNK